MLWLSAVFSQYVTKTRMKILEIATTDNFVEFHLCHSTTITDKKQDQLKKVQRIK
jgi:hypothetical protein